MNAPATLAMGNMSPPQMEQFRSDIATGKAMAMGMSILTRFRTKFPNNATANLLQ